MKKLIKAGRKYSLHISNQGLIPRIFKVFLQVNKGKKRPQLKNGKSLNRYFLKEDIQIAKKKKKEKKRKGR